MFTLKFCRTEEVRDLSQKRTFVLILAIIEEVRSFFYSMNFQDTSYKAITV